jgi:hypothetical protein
VMPHGITGLERVKELPVLMKQATVIKLKYALHCYVCYWYLFVAILN